MPPLDLHSLLSEKLTGARRIAVVGVGSELKADDAAGIIAARHCEKECAADSFKVMYGYTAPENITGEIRAFAPTHLIIIDAADISETPGAIAFIDQNTIEGISFSTHMMPLNILMEYIASETPCTIIVVGIQPATLLFGAPVTPTVSAAAIELGTAIVTASRAILPS